MAFWFKKWIGLALLVFYRVIFNLFLQESKSWPLWCEHLVDLREVMMIIISVYQATKGAKWIFFLHQLDDHLILRTALSGLHQNCRFT